LRKESKVQPYGHQGDSVGDGGPRVKKGKGLKNVPRGGKTVEPAGKRG